MGFKVIGALITFSVISVLYAPVNAEARVWTKLGVELNGKLIRSLAVDSNNPDRIAVIADGEVYETISGGITWNRLDVHGPLDLIYDPSVEGRLIVGTMSVCLKVREEAAGNWVEVRPESGSCMVSRLAASHSQIYFVSGGSQNKVMTYSSGKIAESSFSQHFSQRPYTLAADPRGDDIYVAATQDVFRSQDEGVSWQSVADISTIGCCIGSIWTKGEAVWLVSNNRIYASYDSGRTWTAKGPSLARHYFGQLIVQSDTPYIGVQTESFSGSDVISQTDLPLKKLDLGRMAYQIGVVRNKLLAATADGLWIDSETLPSEAKVKRPVIVLPGIMGSWPKEYGLKGELVLDPITHTYDHLLDRLRAVGFSEENGRLKLFPYQWRQDNATTALQLKQTIDETKIECSCTKVDLVAHSMGGLVARYYIQSEAYAGDVGKLIEIATPNRGSLNSYYLWENGEFWHDGELNNRIMYSLVSAAFRIEAGLKHYASFTDYVRIKIPSVGQLLPDYSYLKGRTYPREHPRNSFLEALNVSSQVTKLKKRVKTYVIGATRVPTLTQLEVSPATGNHTWPDGRVLAAHMGEGDGAVSFKSLSSLGTVNSIINSGHGHLPTSSAGTVIRYLLDDDPDETYLTKIPNQKALQEKASKVKPKPKKVTIIRTSTKAKAKVKDKKGRSTATPKNKIPDSYTFDEEDGRYAIIRDPLPDSLPLIVEVDSPEPTEVGVIQIDDINPVEIVETVIGGPEDSGSAVITPGQGNLPTTITPIVTPTTANSENSDPQSSEARAALNSAETHTRVLTWGMTEPKVLAASSENASAKAHDTVSKPIPREGGSEVDFMEELPGRLAWMALLTLLIALLIIWIGRRKRTKLAADRTLDQA